MSKDPPQGCCNCVSWEFRDDDTKAAGKCNNEQAYEYDRRVMSNHRCPFWQRHFRPWRQYPPTGDAG